jgi:hypothetical protein
MLTQKLEKIKFIPPKKEKNFKVKGKYWELPQFDLWSKGYGKKTPFAVWEIEVQQQFADNNVRKLEEILTWKWKPEIFMFQIFSPNILRSTRKYCNDEVKRLKRKYGNRFIYKPINIKITKNRFNKILEMFEKDKHYAKNYYGNELRKEIERIARESVKILEIST